MNLTITSAQQVTVRLAPRTAGGKVATPAGAPRWTVNQGGCTILPGADGMSCVIVSGDVVGQSVVEVAADFGSGTSVKTLTDLVNVTVTAVVVDPPPPVDDPVTTLGLTADQPVPKQVVVTPPPPSDGSTPQLVLDRIGKDYSQYDHSGEAAGADIYLRPLADTPAGDHMAKESVGISHWVEIPAGQQNDFSSGQGQVLFSPKVALVIDKSGAGWLPNEGNGVARVTVVEETNNAVCEAPRPPYNDPLIDRDTGGHLQFSRDHEGIGRPVKAARGMGGWQNCGFVAYESGYFGTDGTHTAFSPWSGIELALGKKFTGGLAVTSKGEMTVATCVDVATGKGQLVFIANWGGNQGVPNWSPIYHGWQQPHPGAPSIGQFTGQKILGYVDLPFNNPGAVSAVAAPNSKDRVEDTQGNAGLLGNYDLNDQASRDSFNFGHNLDYFSRWAIAVVISRTENKACYVDLSAYFLYLRDLYTTTQAKYDLTKPINPTKEWWKWYYAKDQDIAETPGYETSFPPRFSARPDLAPVVTAVIDVPNPTSVLLTDARGYNGELAIGCEDGNIRFWKGGPQFGASDPLRNPQANGSVKVGRNVCDLKVGKNIGGFLYVARGDREVGVVSTWGPSAQVTLRLRDQRMVDPVAVDPIETHGIEFPGFTVADFNGAQVLTYRVGVLNYATQSGGIYGTGPTAEADKIAADAAVAAGTTPLPPHTEPECGGVLAISGPAHDICTTNVN